MILELERPVEFLDCSNLLSDYLLRIKSICLIIILCTKISLCIKGKVLEGWLCSVFINKFIQSSSVVAEIFKIHLWRDEMVPMGDVSA